MSDISFWENTLKSEMLKSNLQHKLNIVLPKINETDSDIKWYIYDANNVPKKQDAGIESLIKLPPIPSLISNICPGFASPQNRQIWILDRPITLYIPLTGFPRVTNAFLRGNNDDYLANIIMDELAHIRTGLDHDSEAYNKKLLHYRELYYENNRTSTLNDLFQIRGVSNEQSFLSH